MNKYLKICGWGALVIVLLFAIVAALASPIAKHIVNTRGEDILGRQLHAEKVRVNLFTGSVTIGEFQCFEPNGTTNFFYFERLYVKIAYPRLLANRVKIRHLHLECFNGQVLQNNGKLNFSDIIEHFSSDDEEGESERKPWKVYIGDIRIANSSVYYRDVVHGKEWQLEDISLAVPGLDFDNADTNAGLDFALPTGGNVRVEASYLAPSNLLKLTLNMFDVNPNVILPLVQDYINVSGIGAKMNGRLLAQARLDNIQDIDVKGAFDVSDLKIRDSYKNDVVSLEEMRVVLNRFNISQRSFVLDSLVLRGLTGSYEVHKNWSTLSRLKKTDDAGDAAKTKKNNFKRKNQKAAPAAKPVKWMARTAILTAHDVTYSDYSQRNNWSYSFKTLMAEGKNISNYGRNTLKVNATMTHNAKMKGNFTGSWDAKSQDTKFNVTLSNVNLKDFDALCRNYTGYPIESGSLYAETHMEFTSGKLTGNTRLVIDHPSIGKREKLTKAKYRDLPVRSTFKSLVDSENRVVINAPVSADATKKNFSFGSVFAKSLLKETFGHMMKTKSKKDKISDDERAEIEALIGDDESGDAQESKAESRKSKAEKRKSETEKDSKQKEKVSGGKHRNDRKKKH